MLNKTNKLKLLISIAVIALASCLIACSEKNENDGKGAPAQGKSKSQKQTAQPQKKAPAQTRGTEAIKPVTEDELIDFLEEFDPEALEEMDNMKAEGTKPAPKQSVQKNPAKQQMPNSAPGNNPQVTEKEIIKFLEQFDPERLNMIRQAQKNHPDMFAKLMEETKREISNLKELKERDPQRYEQNMRERKMEKELRELAHKCLSSPNKEGKEGLKKEIRLRLEKLFNMRQEQREAESRRIEQELNKLRETIKTRRANKDKIIERRQNELLGQEDELGW